MKFSFAALACALTVYAGGALAHGDYKCAALPKDQWKPHTELQKMLESQGWKLRQIKTSNGCYEVYGKTPEGKRVEAFFDPKNLERVDKDE